MEINPLKGRNVYIDIEDIPAKEEDLLRLVVLVVGKKLALSASWVHTTNKNSLPFVPRRVTSFKQNILYIPRHQTNLSEYSLNLLI